MEQKLRNKIETLKAFLVLLIIICIVLVVWIAGASDKGKLNNSYIEACDRQQQALAESNKTIEELKQLNENMISNMELISQYVSSYRVPSYPRNIDCSPTYLGGISCHSY